MLVAASSLLQLSAHCSRADAKGLESASKDRALVTFPYLCFILANKGRVMHSNDSCHVRVWTMPVPAILIMVSSAETMYRCSRLGYACGSYLNGSWSRRCCSNTRLAKRQSLLMKSVGGPIGRAG